MKLNIQPLAGYCREEVLWKVLKDLSQQMLDSRTCSVSMNQVFLEDDNFSLDSTEAVSEQEAVWQLGALICQLSSGHEAFGGRGAAYQKNHKEVRLPILCKEHAAVTPIIHACMKAMENERISLSELYEKSAIGFQDCKNRESERIKRDVTGMQKDAAEASLDSSWPEEIE